jgi:hypothetical protein
MDMESERGGRGSEEGPRSALNRKVMVGFADERIKQAFIELKKGKGAEPQLYGSLDKAFDVLKKDPFCGIKIPHKLWPDEYVRKYGIDNLWKYNLPDGWRLIYSKS